jgi:formylglycine-generating enzyme required for sulfatase activity
MAGRKPEMQYVKWLSKKTGKIYRFLTDAEWEFAARAGSEQQYAWGDRIGRNRANCDGCGSKWDDKQTAPVGSFQRQ